MTTTASKGNYRYVTKTSRNESQFNIYVKEMIQMIKNEEIKTNLYVKGIKLSKHALERVEQHFDISSSATATKFIKDTLSKATRIGAVLSYDGRINVLYAHDKTAVYLSPDLKTVVTVNKYETVSYEPLASVIKKRSLNKEEAIKLHLEYLEELEQREKEYVKTVLNVELRVKEATDIYQSILDTGKRKSSRKRDIKEMISEHNLMLKKEGKKLFALKVEKRHICKSLVSLY